MLHQLNYRHLVAYTRGSNGQSLPPVPAVMSRSTDSGRGLNCETDVIGHKCGQPPANPPFSTNRKLMYNFELLPRRAEAL
jgi:hypothetical protein